MPSAAQRAALALGRFGDDIVGLEHLDLVGREQRLGQQLQERRLQLASGNGIGTSSRFRSVTASTYSISCLKVHTSGPPIS